MVAVTAMWKVVGRLDNLRRAPGPQGELKKIPRPGGFFIYMREDRGSYFPFPTSESPFIHCFELPYFGSWMVFARGYYITFPWMLANPCVPFSSYENQLGWRSEETEWCQSVR
jgi:hypothetical protein